MKYYLEDLNIPGKFKIENRNDGLIRVPKELENEEAEWLDLVDTVDAEGNPIQELQLDADKKAQALADRAAKKIVNDNSALLLKDKIAALKGKGPADLTTLEEIRAAVLELIELIK